MVVYNESWVSLVNEALSRIGNSQIDSLSDSSNTVAFCNKLLPTAIRTVFGLHNWNCAKKRIQLPPLTERPDFGYNYMFQLPENFSKIIEINSSDYSIEGDKILANEDYLNLVYIKLPEDATEINPSILRAALVTCLAYNLATPLSGSSSITTQLYSEFSQLIAEAKIQNDAFLENDNEVFGETPLWINER